MSAGGAQSAEALDERDVEPRTPMKRLGSTRKLAAFSTIRVQLAEQSRVLETRAEAAAGAAGELHEYCRRRAELEHEYARALDKLARGAQQRHREHWPPAGALACWTAALEHTRSLARDHAALGTLYGGVLAARLARAADDASRLHRKCRDLVAERHEELAAALADAAAAGKAHAHAAADWRAAATKLRHAHDQRAALAAHDPPRHKKMKALDKELEKRRARHSEARARGLRARADYVLSLEAANATLQRYYLDDIVDIMLCMEVGFEAVVGRAVRTAAAGERARAAAAGAAAGALLAAADALDALADRQRTLDAHAAAFALPRPLPSPPAPAAHDAEMRALLAGAAPDSDAAAEAAAAELAQRLQQLETGARQLRAECRESAKTLDAAEAELVRQMEGEDAQWEPETAAALGADAEPPRRDQEDYYLHKFRSYVACAGRLARLEARAAAARGLLPPAGAAPPAEQSPPSPPRRAAARLRRGQFAAPLGRRLPAVLTSCVRVIASYGLHHQGVFRVSGSQVEMQALRAAFERGEDPLASVRDAADINSVCGLLKLYLRELRPPLLPPQLQDSLLRVAAEPDDAEFARRLRATLAALPLPGLLVLRYLFAFLAHLAEHSERNMMDAWNLAICLGPTLLAAWGEGGAQVAAQNLVNELVKRTILHHAAVFPQDVAPDALYTRHEHAAHDDNAAHDEHAAHDDRVDGLPSIDDLSLFDDDDDEISEDGESGEWRDDDPCARAATAAPAGSSRRPSTDAAQRAAAAAPDLVLDLPARTPPAAAPPATPAPAVPSAAPPAATAASPGTPPAAKDDDAADNFAHNRDTLKKRNVARPSEPAAAGVPAASVPAVASSGSPVPARNTLRVAAQFAELTLTGGSKPAPAAKPALLRRPTPHPQHARPAAAPTVPAAPAPLAPREEAAPGAEPSL